MLWYHKSRHTFISEGAQIYNFPSVPENYDVVVDTVNKSYDLRITNAKVENTGWYECGFRNKWGNYQILSDPAYVTVRNSGRAPGQIVALTECRIFHLPKVDGMESEIDINCVWGTNRPEVRASLFFKNEEITPNITTSDRIIARIPSSPDLDSYVCQVVVGNSSSGMNSTCTVETNGIARIRMDPLVNEVYEGKPATI